MRRSAARFPSLTRSQYVEDVFGADPTGVTDSTTALIAAGASGLNLKFYENGIYRLTAEIPLLAGTRFLGDGSQTFRQNTSNIGLFLMGDDSCVKSVNGVYAPDRSVAIASISQANPGVLGTLTPHPWSSGDRIRITKITAGMTEINDTTHFVEVISSTSVRLYGAYSGGVFSLPRDTTGYSAYTSGGEASFQPASYNGLSGWQRIAMFQCQGDNVLIEDCTVSNFFTGAALYGPLVELSPGVIDAQALSNDARLINLACDSCDFGITAGQYDGILIDNVSLANPTRKTVPGHIIYLQNPKGTGDPNEGFCKNILVRNINAQGWYVGGSSEALKFSNCDGLTIESTTLIDCDSGISISRSFNTQVNARILDMIDTAFGIRTTDIGSDHKFINCEIKGATDASITAFLIDDYNDRVTIDTPDITTDNATWGSTRLITVATESQARVLNPRVTHLQSNTAYACGTSGTGTKYLDVTLPALEGGTRICRLNAGGVGTILVDPNLLPSGYDPTSTSWLNADGGTLKARNIAGETFFTSTTAPTLAGSTVAGANTYGAASSFTRVYRLGKQVWFGSMLRLAAFDGVTITGITQANPGVVTAVGHGFSTGKVTAIQGVAGMTQINGQLLTITVLTADTFSVGIDTTAYGAYTSGGKAARTEGAMTAGNLPYTVNGGVAGGGVTVNAVVECDIAANLQGLPASHSGIKAELIDSTKTWRYFYFTPSTTGHTRTYLTAANFTDTTDLGFICKGYYTDDAP